MFISSKRIENQLKSVESLNQYCTKIITKYKYEDGDTRTVTLANIRSFGFNSLAILNFLSGMASTDENRRKAAFNLLGLQNQSAKEIQIMGNILHKSSKLSFILLGQFQIENCIALLSEAIGITSGWGFYKISMNLLEELGLDQNNLDVLNTAALIRNSLHSNGIHHGYKNGDFSSNLDGVNYEFKHGKKVSCASFSHIAHALESSTIVLDEIFNTTKVLAQTAIEDKYVRQMTNKEELI